MRLNLYDEALTRLAAIEDRFVSCLWSEGYNTLESFVVELQDTAEYRKKVRPGCFVGRSDRNTLMVITTAEVKDGRISASGFPAARILRDVSFIGTIPENSPVSQAIVDAYNGSGSKKGLLSAEDSDLADVYPSQISNKSILELCETMCQTADVGFRAVRAENKLFLQFYKPENTGRLIYSENFGNLSISSVVLSTENLKNYAIVLGEGEGDARTRIDVDQTDGGERLDLIVDARDLTKEENEADESYLLRLTARGKEKLLEHKKTWECAFSVAANDFGSKFDLGDVLTVVLPDMGITLTARVARFSQKEQKNQTKTTIEVGEITIRKG